MNYSDLLDLATDLGYELAMCGAETFRIEESINRILQTYGVSSEVFAIPNCLIVSIETPEGKLMTRMRRIGYHGNDLDGVECFNAISRAICNRKPSMEEARKWFNLAPSIRRNYSLPLYLLGNIAGAFGFAFFFGGNLTDAILSGICGLVAGLMGRFMGSTKTNPFFKTIASSFAMALLAYAMAGLGMTNNVDARPFPTCCIKKMREIHNNWSFPVNVFKIFLNPMEVFFSVAISRRSFAPKIVKHKKRGVMIQITIAMTL